MTPGPGFVPDPEIMETIAAIGDAAAANEAALNPGGVSDGEPVPAEIAAQDLHLAGRHVGADDPAVIEAAAEAVQPKPQRRPPLRRRDRSLDRAG
ncbi:MAG: hypothetical protein U0670_04050 [Anaerolineae bacterium]